MKKLIYIFIVLLSFITLAGCSETKKFYTREVSIHASRDYTKFEKNPYALYLENEDSFIGLFRETKDVINSNVIYDFDKVTLKEYINMYCSTNNIGELETLEEDGLAYIEYTLTKSSGAFFVKIYFFKTKASFWACQFCCIKDKQDEYSSKFTQWVKTIDI